MNPEEIEEERRIVHAREREASFFSAAEVISRYTRAQAIEDGVLIPVEALVPDEPDFARQAGWLVPVALTLAAAYVVRPTPEEQRRGQDLKGRLWDLLSSAHRAARAQPSASEGAFRCFFSFAGRSDYPARQSLLSFKSLIGPGDNAEPVCTIMLPEED